MATLIQIPAEWVNDNSVDINDFLLAEGYTVVQRDQNNHIWIITVAENLTPGQQLVLSNRLSAEFNTAKFQVI